MYIYVRYVKRSLAAIGGRFHGQVNPTRLSVICTVCDCQSQRLHWTTVSVLVDSKGNNQVSSVSLLILSFTELLLQAYEKQCGILLS